MNTHFFIIAFLLLFTSTFSKISAQEIKYKYPYVENGNTIVSRDALGGVRPEYLLNADEIAFLMVRTASYIESDKYNKVSPKFQVSKINLTTSAQSSVNSTCNSYNELPLRNWRAPTQRELMLISIFDQRKELTAITQPITNTWSGTLSSIGTGQAWYLSQTNNTLTEMKSIIISTRNAVRCVKDL